jgi:5-methylcytosine-specific restriction endonuclease McrA
MDQNEFLIQHLTEGKSYDNISKACVIPRKQLSEWWESGKEMRDRIKRANDTFNSRVGNVGFAYFKEKGKRFFFEWYDQQEKKCAYCGIEEWKLEKIFDFESGILKTKRGRGRKLELERKDAKTNQYTLDNCVLSCYLCNNHKSDLISEADHMKYFARPIREYLEAKYREIGD